MAETPEATEKKRGPGRPPGSMNKHKPGTTRTKRFVNSLQLPTGVKDLKRLALATLEDVMQRSASDPARVAAAQEVLRRCDALEAAEREPRDITTGAYQYVGKKAREQIAAERDFGMDASSKFSAPPPPVIIDAKANAA